MEKEMNPLEKLKNNIISDVLSKEFGVFDCIEVATPATKTGKISMIIGFSGMEKTYIPKHELNINAKVMGYSKRPDTTRIIEYDFEHPSQIEKMLLECAWVLGSAFIERFQYYPYESNKGWTGREPGAGITRLFEGSQYRSPLFGPMSIGQTDSSLTDLSIKYGYWYWTFRSTYNQHLPEADNIFWKKWYAEDETRNDKGFRDSCLSDDWKIQSMEQTKEGDIIGRSIKYDFIKEHIYEGILQNL